MATGAADKASVVAAGAAAALFTSTLTMTAGGVEVEGAVAGAICALEVAVAIRHVIGCD